MTTLTTIQAAAPTTSKELTISDKSFTLTLKKLKNSRDGSELFVCMVGEFADLAASDITADGAITKLKALVMQKAKNRKENSNKLIHFCPGKWWGGVINHIKGRLNDYLSTLDEKDIQAILDSSPVFRLEGRLSGEEKYIVELLLGKFGMSGGKKITGSHQPSKFYEESDKNGRQAIVRIW